MRDGKSRKEKPHSEAFCGVVSSKLSDVLPTYLDRLYNNARSGN